ncbi:hypothetical protein AAEX28_00390 [Lentisphaerota bacterium WC36G]|nr:hypothetical protein LJT99_03270 [Lentisphaerae bacterium WC36]
MNNQYKKYFNLLRLRLKSNKGVALLVVTTMLMMVAFFCGAIIMIAQTAALTTRATTGISKFNLLAEGAANRVKWIILWDKAQKNPRSLGNEATLEKTQELGFDRYLADGRVYTLNYYGYDIDVWVKDAAAGLNFYTDQPDKVLDYFKAQTENEDNNGLAGVTGLENNEDLDELEDFKKLVKDYVDQDSETNFDSMEKDEYEGEDKSPLPRDEIFQFREEILWISKSEKFFEVNSFGQIDLVRILPPEGLSEISASDNLFSVPLDYIKTISKLEDEEVKQVAEAIKEWLSNDTPIEESLELELYTKIKNKFSMSESGYYTIKVRPGRKSQILIPGRILSETLEIGDTVGQDGFRFYEWAFY